MFPASVSFVTRLRSAKTSQRTEVWDKDSVVTQGTFYQAVDPRTAKGERFDTAFSKLLWLVVLCLKTEFSDSNKNRRLQAFCRLEDRLQQLNLKMPIGPCFTSSTS